MTHQFLSLLNLSALIHKTVMIQSNQLCYCKALVIYCNYLNRTVFDYRKQLLGSLVIVYLARTILSSIVIVTTLSVCLSITLSAESLLQKIKLQYASE